MQHTAMRSLFKLVQIKASNHFLCPMCTFITRHENMSAIHCNFQFPVLFEHVINVFGCKFFLDQTNYCFHYLTCTNLILFGQFFFRTISSFSISYVQLSTKALEICYACMLAVDCKVHGDRIWNNSITC